MSPPGRPKDESRSAQHEGSPVTAIAVTVVWATPAVQDLVDVELPAAATVADALRQSGLVEAYALDLPRLGFSVDGRRARLATTLADGDRVDITRALLVDPKEVRRLRADARPLRPSAKPKRHSRG
jgi:putative ubiquitin-RnfH superfamily antitoxin RatB of RatAB toxin-antitoxin module